MESFQLMLEAGNYLPEHIKPWLTWMQVVLFLVPVLFVRHRAPRYLLLAQLLNAATAYLVFMSEGYRITKLFGVGHLYWLVPLWMLAVDVRNREKWVVYRAYAAMAVLTMAISLVFDVRDTALWLMGDRGSVLVHVPVDSALHEYDAVD